MDTPWGKAVWQKPFATYSQADGAWAFAGGINSGFNYFAVLTFISFYSKQLHSEKAASFFLFVYAFTVIIFRPFSGRLPDVRSTRFVLYPCLFIFAIGLLLLSQTNSGVTLVLAGALMGLDYGNFLSCGQTISIKETPPKDGFGLATATYNIFLDVWFGIGPYLFGTLAPFMGYRSLYLMMAAVIIAMMILYTFPCQKEVSRSGKERDTQ